MTNALAVVAHHDDHIIWMGGTILRTKAVGWTWTVVAMCAPAKDRADYFRRCCSAHGVEAITLTFGDYMEGALYSKNSREQMRLQLVNSLRGKVFDVVFTHSHRDDGEYGKHANHFEVCGVVDEFVGGGELGEGCDSIAYFSYQAIYRRAATVARRDAQVFVQLNYDELLEKCKWVMKAPDAQSNLKNIGFPCPNPEAFDCSGSVMSSLIEPLL